jgi:hypothetical protein
MAARLASLRAPDGLSLPPELTFTPAQSLENYPRAQEAYAAVRRSHPSHAQQAALQSSHDLTETLAAGLLFDVRVSGTWAGYVAATTSSDETLGLPAYVVQELVLATEFRARGYGPHLTTTATHRVPHSAAGLNLRMQRS